MTDASRGTRYIGFLGMIPSAVDPTANPPDPGFRGARAPLSTNALQSWTHVAATYGDGDIKLYVDGVQVGQYLNVPGAGDLATGGSLRIGNGVGINGSTVWTGEIDELRIWPFARTQTEILETINDSLVLVPNGVSFNLDNVLLDTSQFLQGTATAGVTFVAGNPALGAPIAVGGTASYTPTTTCIDDLLRVGVGSSSRAGNLGFELVCTEAPPMTNGGVLLAAGNLGGIAFPILGFDLWLDPFTFLPIVPPVTSDFSGTARLPLALTATTQIGLTLHTQFVFADPCGNAGLSSSQMLSFMVQ